MTWVLQLASKIINIYSKNLINEQVKKLKIILTKIKSYNYLKFKIIIFTIKKDETQIKNNKW